MAFKNNPLDPIDRMRLLIGDIDPDLPLVEDQWYAYYLSQNNNNEKKTAIQVAKNILAQYANSASRERVDQVEIYGKEQFDSYLKWLKDLVTNPALGLLSPAMPYAGGISRTDFCTNNANPDNIRLRRPIQCHPDQEDFYTVRDGGCC